MTSLLIRGARQLLTLRGAAGPRRGAALRELGIIADGAVLVRNGLIEEVGPSRRVENLAAARHAEVIDAGGKVVMPGFVDSHAYLAHGAETTAGRLEIRARHFLHSMARHGTTTCETKCGDLRTLRVAARLDVVSSYSAFAPDPLLPAIRRRRLARFVDASLDYPGDAAGVLKAARAAGFLLKGQARQTPVVWALPWGLVSVDRLECATAADAAALAASGTVATLLPAIACQAPARMLLDAGAAVALATGFNPETSPGFSMQMAVSLACSRMGLTPAEALAAATINGAHALRCADRAGSLEVDKYGDLIILNVSDYREIPYYFGVNSVHQTIRRGVAV